MGASSTALGQAISSELLRLAIAYNDALDRCTQTGGENIDEVMSFLAADAERIVVGAPGQVGSAAIREHFLRRTERLQQVVELKGIELWGDLVTCRVERRDTTHTQSGAEHHLRILLIKGDKIKRLIVIVDPEEDARLRGGTAQNVPMNSAHSGWA
jgi:hypothetical protein